mmetsp:Transcript_102684/g.329100  ORF Transcript_102684/g.329100 Transcript_102684/m.329100 type:complete len:230 (+) Transcript_102684:4398-5087(+)
MLLEVRPRLQRHVVPAPFARGAVGRDALAGRGFEVVHGDQSLLLLQSFHGHERLLFRVRRGHARQAVRLPSTSGALRGSGPHSEADPHGAIEQLQRYLKSLRLGRSVIFSEDAGCQLGCVHSGAALDLEHLKLDARATVGGGGEGCGATEGELLAGRERCQPSGGATSEGEHAPLRDIVDVSDAHLHGRALSRNPPRGAPGKRREAREGGAGGATHAQLGRCARCPTNP